MTAELPTPPLPTPHPHPQLDQLIAVLEHLRAPGGCAWDAEQTHESLVQYLVEESHELIDAIEHGSREDVLEELGDVLYQVLFHADIAAAGAEHPFTIEDVAAATTAKMVGRHPHVFGDAVADTAEDVAANWETWKRQQKPARTSVLDGVARGLPALARAEKVLGRAQSIGVSPRLRESEEALADERELGEQLMALVAEARAQGLDAERALRTVVRKLEDQIRAAESADARPADRGAASTSGVVD